MTTAPRERIPLRSALALGLWLASMAAACSGPPADPSPAGVIPEPAEAAEEAGAAEPDPLEHLRGLGYVAWDTGTDPGKKGVTFLDEERASPGYNLYSDATTTVHLMSNRGETVHTWKIPNTAGNCEHAELGPRGELALVCPSRSLNLLGRDSEVLWTLKMQAHHDVAFLPGGEILLPYHQSEQYKGRKVLFDGIATISPGGEILEQWYIFDRLDHFQPRHPPLPLDTPPERTPGDAPDPGYDYYHLNTIEILPETDLGRRDRRFRAGNLLICLRNAGLIAVLDPATRRILWHWGPGVLDMPHTPRMLPDGRILIFDNGYFRGHSRVIEIDPVTEEIVWSYRGDPPESFFSKVRGSSQRLPNGNTLICESERGRAFEVTPGGEIVWEFWNPVISGDKRKRIYRMWRVTEAEAAGLLDLGS